MKYAYEVKLVKKAEAAATIEDMESEGWATHRITEDAVVFRRPVPDNYVEAWFVIDYETVNGKDQEVKHGPYYSAAHAETVVDPGTTLRVDKTWVAPDSAGSRMDRIAFMAAASPDDPPPVKANPPKPKRKPRIANNGNAHLATPNGNMGGDAFPDTLAEAADRVRNSIRTHVPAEDLNRLQDFINRSNATPVTPVTAPFNPSATNRAAVPRRPATVRTAPARGAARPQQQQQVRTGILDAMRGPSAVPVASVASKQKDPEEPSDADIKDMISHNQRILQAMRRHDQ